MPVAPINSSSSHGVPFMVAAGLVFEIVAAACSSPQTTELNADKRAETLMKWVGLGLLGSALFVGIAIYLDRGNPVAMKAEISGGALAGGLMGAAYAHAKNAGLSSDAPGTEDY